jgi:UDP-N-acetylmuramoyl-tripeptide--D-alanyl-D-alanine ligase
VIRGRLAEAAAWVGGVLTGDDGEFAGVSTDTRSLEAGELFVALEGPNFDGHEFIGSAVERGAAGAVVAREIGAPLAGIRVADTLSALGALAGAWRQTCDPTVVGVTGSSGKTTVKELLAAILSTVDQTLVTRGNFNNEVGVPLTLFRLEPGHRYAVIEMGANHVGEIARLAAIARPDVGLITMAGPSHLEGFGDLDGVARGKGEMFTALSPEGTAILNADDAYADFWRELSAHARVVCFGLGPDADVKARGVEPLKGDVPGSRFELITPAGAIDIELPLPGRHNVMNALAAAAAAQAAGAGLEQIRAGLAVARGVAGRLNLTTGPGDVRIIDDTYNANPASVTAALDVLVNLPGRAWAVLGDMGELGPDAESLHRQIGAAARARGVERLYALGPLSRSTAAGFGADAVHCDNLEALLRRLEPELEGDVNLLVKGSRMMRLERLVEALIAAAPAHAKLEGTD